MGDRAQNAVAQKCRKVTRFMLKPHEFRNRWVTTTPDPYRRFEKHELEALNLLELDRQFLEEPALPVFASPWLYFGEKLARIEGTPYVVIGSTADDNPICVDNSGNGVLVTLDKRDFGEVHWFSRSVSALCETLLAHREMIAEARSVNGRRAWFDNDIPDFLIRQFHAKLRQIDLDTADRDGSFWKKHIRWLLSHAVKPQPIFDVEEKKTISPSMGELEFIDLIDCNFYFETLEDFENAVRVGCRISEHAALTVGWELARGFPKGHVPFRLRLLKLLKEELPTPLILTAFPVIEALIIDRPADPRALRKLVDLVTQNGGPAVALHLVLDADPSFEEEYDRIVQEWQSDDAEPT